jgi:epoxyqueuosine reductase
MSDTPFERAATVKAFARELGFDLVGIARPDASAYRDAYRAWVAAGKMGEMQYLARDVEERLDLRRRFPWVKSVVCVALAYWQEHHDTANGTAEPTGKIARYAWGRDYHKVMESKLKKLERHVRAAFETPVTRVAPPAGGEKLEVRFYADTGPMLERELAARAGLGWVGKNTLLIHPRHGSWFVLGEMMLSVELAPDEAIGDHCGTCRRCVEACPTEAIGPYSVDARKCISYVTLEHRGEIGEELEGAMGEAGFLVGCDICQEVCPFNRRPLATREGDFAVREPAPAVSLEEVLGWEEQEWDKLTRGRATRRAKFSMWKRNAEVVGKRRRR